MGFLFVFVSLLIIVFSILTNIIWIMIFKYNTNIKYGKNEQITKSLIKFMLICASITFIGAIIMFETKLFNYNPFIIN